MVKTCIAPNQTIYPVILCGHTQEAKHDDNHYLTELMIKATVVHQRTSGVLYTSISTKMFNTNE